MKRTKMTLLMMAMATATVTMACDEDPGGLGELRQDLDEESPDSLVGPASSQASSSYPEVSVVAWADGDDIRTVAYCTEYELDPNNSNRCTCDGLDGLGWTGFDGTQDIKCKMCTDSTGQWPCSLEPNAGTEVSVRFLGGDEVRYSYVDDGEIVTVGDPWYLSCDEPPASCPHTCDPGGESCSCSEESLEFAAVRPYWNSGERHITAQGGLIIDLGDTCSQ